MNWPNPTPKNIIVRMPNWLGDLVMATPVLKDLRDHFPDATITAMCQKNVAGLLTSDPNINEIFSFEKPSGWIHRSHHIRIIDPLRNGEYDLGILLTNSFSSAWWFWRGQVKNRIGYNANYRGLLLNKALPFPKEKETQHLVITYKMLLEPLGIPVSNSGTRLYVSEKEQKAALSLLERFGINKSKHRIIGINPGAAYGSAKCWLPDRFEAVTHKLIENENTRVIYFGDNIGKPLVDDICKNMPDSVVNLAGKTSLRELLALIECCDAFLTNDSGPMHIASALGVPLLALFGSTSEVKTGPYEGGTIIHKHVECSPCYKRECPIDFRCMTRIGVDEVYEKIQEILNRSKSQ